ncbi:hypothetical protein ACLOJK_013102 [Asimina triloba]
MKCFLVRAFATASICDGEQGIPVAEPQEIAGSPGMHPKQQHAPHTNNNKHMMCTCKESSIQSTTLSENKLISSLRCAVDTDGFVIPSLSVGESDQVEADVPNEKGLKPSSPKVKEEEKIYLGPHGAPPSQAKQQELNATGRKQRLKYKLKEADRKFAGTGRENKVENLRELVGSSKANTTNMGKDSPRDWLDPHCHESQFEKKTQEKKGSNLEGEIEGDGGVVAKDAATIAPLKRKDAFFIDNPNDAVHRALESGRPSEDGGGKDGSLVEEKRFGEGSGARQCWKLGGTAEIRGRRETSRERAI